MERGRSKSDGKRVEIDMGELEEILRRAAQALPPKDVEKLQALVETFVWLQGEIRRKDVSLSRLRQLFGTQSTEKTRHVLGDAPKTSAKKEEGDDEKGEPPQRDLPQDVTPSESKGHGRYAAADYPGAERVRLKHESLKAGDPCPEPGCDGKLYARAEPRVLVCLKGHAPLAATVYEREALRCSLCGRVFTAGLPPGHDCKYDASAAAMIALLKYGSGVPFYRLEGLERNLGIPLPAATQWEIVEEAAQELLPVYEELRRQAAQGEVIHNDDTSMTILAHEKENRARKEAGERYGTFTTGFVALVEDRRVALFATGRPHAGENLTTVLQEREGQRPPPIQMCDGLDRNEPDEPFKTILANCLGHGRRRFVELVEDFPEEVRHVLETLRDVYRHDAQTRRAKMSPQERLRYHQEHSGPLMAGLATWFQEQFDQKKIEPNSRLGDAIRYMQKRWGKLTLFLKVPGAPLDNNICERALKKAILHRKNALFFKTENGAKVGDIFMSLIHTAELNAVNAFHYLTQLLRHAKQVADDAEAWMPWNYRHPMPAARSP
jgi:transposase